MADSTSGFKGFRRRALEAIDLGEVRSDGYAFQIEMTFRAWKAGFRVVGEASDGLEAIEAFQDRRPDVVILDVTMPRMDGITTLKKIMELDPAARVIMSDCSGHSTGRQGFHRQALPGGTGDFRDKEDPEHRLMKRFAGCIVLALLRVLPLSAAEQPGLLPGIPVDEAEYFVIGLSILEGLGLSAGNEYLTSSIPLLLKEQIEAMEHHEFSPTEQAAYREKILAEEVRLEARELAELRADRDELLFSALSRRARREQAASLDARIEEVAGRIQVLRSFSPGDVAFAGSKPVQIVTGTRSGRLLETPLFSPRPTPPWAAAPAWFSPICSLAEPRPYRPGPMSACS